MGEARIGVQTGYGCGAQRDGMISGAGVERLGVNVMRITIDTSEDSYEDALGVLRRAYGRHRLTRTAQELPAVPEAADLSSANAVAQVSDNRSAPGVRRGDAGPKKPPAKATKKAAAKRSPASRAVAQSPVSKSTAKKASGKKAGRRASASGRPGAPRKRSASRVAANTAPRGQSEAVRAWAQEQGMQVRTRGRMPAKVISAYLEAHNA